MMDLCRAITGFPFERVVVLDTETTGLNAYDDEILSISFTDIDGNVLFSSLLKPKRKRSWPGAQAVNGISPSMVKNAPTFDQVADKVSSFINDNTLIVGYNTQFDVDFIFATGKVEYPTNTFDVMREFSTVHGRTRRGDRYRWVKLAECAAYYGYTFEAHESLSDARATAYAFKSLLCDPAYQRKHAARIESTYSGVPMSQNTTTRKSIISLIGSDFASGDFDAELRMGAITRGQNKGKPRYECFVNDMMVGVCDLTSMGTFRRAFMVDCDELLPQSFGVTASLSSKDDSQRCSVSLPIKKRALDSMKELSASVIVYGKPGIFPPSSKNSSTPIKNIGADACRFDAIQIDSQTNKEQTSMKGRWSFIPLCIGSALLLSIAIIGFISFEPSLAWIITEAIFVVPGLILAKKAMKKLS